MSKVTPPAGAGVDKLTVKVNVVVPLSPSFRAMSLIVKTGNTACTAVVDVAELLLVLWSGVAEVIVAVFVTVSPGAALTVTTRVIVSSVPLNMEAKLTVRSLPLPPQTPAPVELQETNETLAGK